MLYELLDNKICAELQKNYFYFKHNILKPVTTFIFLKTVELKVAKRGEKNKWPVKT